MSHVRLTIVLTALSLSMHAFAASPATMRVDFYHSGGSDFRVASGRLWRWAGNDSELYETSAAAGWLETIPQSGAVVIDASDFHENGASVSIPIEVDPVDRVFPQATNRSSTRGEVRYDEFGYGIVVTVEFDRPEDEAPRLLERNEEAEVVFTRVREDFYRCVYLPSTEEADVILNVLHPRVEARPHRFIAAYRGMPHADFRFGNLTGRIDSFSPYGLLLLSARPIEVDAANELVVTFAGFLKLAPQAVDVLLHQG